MCREVWEAVAKDTITEDEAIKSARADWKQDARGLETMPFGLFFDAIFQLADLYVETIDPDDYVKFLDDIRVTFVRVIPEPSQPSSGSASPLAPGTPRRAAAA